MISLKKILYALIFSLSFTPPILAQKATNLDVIYSLIERSTSKFEEKINAGTDSLSIGLNLPDSYSILRPKILNGIHKNISIDNDRFDLPVYTLENIFVEYPKVERDGFLGELIVERLIKVEGNFLFVENSNKNFEEFEFFSKDTVNYSDIAELENGALPFTGGTLPDEPVASSFIEPAVAIITAVAAIVLFFSVRTK